MGKRSPGRACGIMMSLMNLLHSSLGMLESRLKEIKALSKDPSLSSTNDDVSEDKTPTTVCRLFEDTNE